MSGSGEWIDCYAGLVRWRVAGDRHAAEEALRFLEPQLRVRVPLWVREGLGQAAVDALVQSFLEKMLAVSLPQTVESPRGYLIRAFQNHARSEVRSLRRRKEVPEQDLPALSAAVEPDGPIEVERSRSRVLLLAALERLSVEDRIILKLQIVPEWISPQDLLWLSGRTGASPAEISHRIICAEGSYELSLVFEPSTGRAGSKKDRSRRLDRFRKRKDRALERLRTAMKEVGGQA